MVITLVNKEERDSEGERKPSPRRVVQFPWVDSEEEKERTERGFLSRKVRNLLVVKKEGMAACRTVVHFVFFLYISASEDCKDDREE
jgi:hypothetical protein